MVNPLQKTLCESKCRLLDCDLCFDHLMHLSCTTRGAPWTCCSYFQQILPASPTCTAPLATSCRAAGKARCSASFTRSDRVSTVSPTLTGTASWKMIAPASTSSCKSNSQSLYGWRRRERGRHGCVAINMIQMPQGSVYHYVITGNVKIG